MLTPGGETFLSINILEHSRALFMPTPCDVMARVEDFYQKELREHFPKTLREF